MDAVELERVMGRVGEEGFHITLHSVNLHLMKNAPQFGRGSFMSQYGIELMQKLQFKIKITCSAFDEQPKWQKIKCQLIVISSNR